MKCTIWNDCRGGIITTELVLVASFVTAMLLGGLGLLKTKISKEFESLGQIVESQHTSITSELNPEPSSQTQFEQGITFEGDLDFERDSVRPNVNF